MGSFSGAISARAAVRVAVATCTCVALAGCVSSGKLAKRVDPKYGVSSSPRVVSFGQAVPKGGGTYRVGKPYTIAGRTYVPQENQNYRAEGMASWYGDDFHGRLTANGEIFDMTSLTAAHPTMPLPSYARVTNLRNGKSLIVRVNDRGPYHGNRIIDVSNRAAKLLEFQSRGVAPVRVEYVGRASLTGSDDQQLLATLRTGEPAPSPSAVRIAAARPFVPDTSSTYGGGRSVPMPAERPYTLGGRGTTVADASGEMPLMRSSGVVAAGVRSVASAEPSVPTARATPVSAYAPTSGRDTGRDEAISLMSGRGLY